MRALTDVLPQMVWDMGTEDDEMNCRNVQVEAYYRPLGSTLAERAATKHSEDAKRQTAFASGQVCSLKGRLRCHDGMYRCWQKLVINPVRQDSVEAIEAENASRRIITAVGDILAITRILADTDSCRL